jgi:hypothetical protein
MDCFYHSDHCAANGGPGSNAATGSLTGAAQPYGGFKASDLRHILERESAL